MSTYHHWLVMASKPQNKIKSKSDLLRPGGFCSQHSAQTRYQYLAYHPPCTFLMSLSHICKHKEIHLFITQCYILHIMNWNRICPYFCRRKSIMKVDGFPTTIGSLSVDPHIAATIQPAPRITSKNLMLWQPNCYFGHCSLLSLVTIPGHSCRSVICPTASRLVAMKRHPGFSRTQRVPYLPFPLLC